LFEDFFGLFGVVPEGGVEGVFFVLGYLKQLGINVKGTPSTQPGALEFLERVRMLPWRESSIEILDLND